MPLLLGRAFGLDNLQPMAAGLEDEPDPGPRSPNQPPVINTYDPSVERWRNSVWEGMPDDLKSRPDAAVLLDKALHVIRGESGGDPNAVGDGGVAHGLFQSHYVGANASPDAQIADAWRLVSRNPDQWTDWGEGVTYNGQPFGALGRTPYGAGDNLAQHLSTGQTSNFAPAPNLPPPPPLPSPSLQPLPDFTSPNYGDIPYDAGSAALTQNTGDIPFAQGQQGQAPVPPVPGTGFGSYGPNLLNQLPGRQGFAQESSGQPYTTGTGTTDNPLDLLTGAYNAANVRVPLLTPALEVAQSGVQSAAAPVIRTAVSALTGGPAADIASQLGGENIPILGPALRSRREALNAVGEAGGEQAANLIPTRALDIGLTAAPLAGEVGRAGAAIRGGLERGAGEALAEEAPKVFRVAARSDAIAPAPEGLAASRGAVQVVDPAGVRVLGPGETVQAGEQELYHGGSIQGAIRPGTFLTPDPQDAKVFANVTNRLGTTGTAAGEGTTLPATGGEPTATTTTGPTATTTTGAEGPTGEGVQREFTPGEEPGGQGPTFQELPGHGGMSPEDYAKQKLITQIQLVDTVPTENAAAISAQKSQRAAIAAEIDSRTDLTAQQKAEQIRNVLFQRGEMERASHVGPQLSFSPEETDALHQAINNSGLQLYQRANATDALKKVLGGDFIHLQQNELNLLDQIFGPELSYSIDRRIQEMAPSLRWDQKLSWALGRGVQNLYSLIQAPTSTATFGHFIPLRIGRGFMLTNPEARSEAFRNFFKVLQNPDNLEALRAAREELPFVGAEDSEAAQMGVRAKDLITSNLRPDPTFVDSLMAKLGLRGNRVQQATSEYLSTLRDIGYNELAQRKLDEGVTDPLAYKDLWETVSHATGHGLANQPTGIPNPLFSANQLLAKWKTPLDITRATPAARGVALKSLAADFAAGVGFLKFAEMAGLGDVNWNINGPAGLRLKIGASTIDPFAGYGSQMRLFGRLYDAATSGEAQFSKAWNDVRQYGEGQLSPGYRFLLSAITGEDYAGRSLTSKENLTQLLKDSEPLVLQSMQKAIAANGPTGAAIAAPSLLGTSVETPDSLTARRDQVAQQLGLKDYASANPLQQQQINKDQSIAGFKEAHPTSYEAAAKAAHDPILADVAQQEDLFNRGMNTQKLRDTYHDATERSIQAALDLNTQFSDQFANIPTDKQKQLLQQYYDLSKNPAALIPSGQPGEGTLDFDKLASLRQDFLSKLPADQQTFINQSLQATELNKTPLKQQYDKYIAAKKDAGYFDIKPDDPDYSKKIQALDRAHPDIDAQAWRYGATAGKAGGSLQSKSAVDQALAMNVPNVPVHDGTLQRDLSTPQARQLWAARGAQVAALEDGSVYTKRYGDSVAQERFQKNYADLTPAQQSSVLTSIRNAVLDSDPQMDALWVYFGGSANSTEKHYVLRSQASLPYLQQLIKQYGGQPIKDGWNFGVSNR